MRIIFKNENETLFLSVNSVIVPSVGDEIQIHRDDYIVEKISWWVETNQETFDYELGCYCFVKEN